MGFEDFLREVLGGMGQVMEQEPEALPKAVAPGPRPMPRRRI